VKEDWDGLPHKTYWYYTVNEVRRWVGVENEYRIKVGWDLDLSDSPISIRELKEQGLNQQPRGTVRKIVQDRAVVERLIKEWWALPFCLPEELAEASRDAKPSPYVEGATWQVTVNAYERNRDARQKCIEHHGVQCYICGFSFGAVYGAEAEEFIHVHHRKPLSEIRTKYKVDPVKDLVPLCPNCHAFVHLGGGCRDPDEVRDLLLERQKNALCRWPGCWE
jgi:predicted HNH restriction endonuclease